MATLLLEDQGIRTRGPTISHHQHIIFAGAEIFGKMLGIAGPCTLCQLPSTFVIEIEIEITIAVGEGHLDINSF